MDQGSGQTDPAVSFGVNPGRAMMKSLKGHLLVAAPCLHDPNFTQTVLLLFQHSPEGAAGIILNRPTEATITDIAEQVFVEPFEWDKPILIGGPVAGSLLVLHKVESLSDYELIPGVYGTFDSTKIQAILRQKAEPSLIVANYAGWGPGQLETEMEDDSWLDFPASADHVFWEGARDLWDAVVKEINSAQFSRVFGFTEVPDDPMLN
jgi:putative transcriptional regulator